jgi:hypothetical protein
VSGGFLLVAPENNLSENAKKVYQYLSSVEKASKPTIMSEVGLAKEEDYLLIKKELLSQALVVGVKGRSGGLALSVSVSRRGRSEEGASRESRVIQATREPSEDHVEKLSEKARKLWNLIPPDGGFVTNLRLRYSVRPLGFSTDDFWEYRKELFDNGLIQIGRGRGGRVARIQKFVEEEPKVKLPSILVREESKLYEELRKWLDKNVVKGDEESGGQAWARVTATARRSGHWSTPDVVLVEVTSYEYLPNRDVTVTTYEIKRYASQMDNSWVFEAASHSKGAHYSYLVVETLENKKTDEPPPELSPDLRQFGIGFGWLYLKKDTKEYEFEEILEPDRKNPNPEDENELLGHYVSKLKPAEQTAFRNAIK